MKCLERIYLDHAATSPMHPSVIEKMTKTMTDHFGNPSSIHSFGREARQLVDEARIGIAQSIGAKETEIIFTSGGTEADNMPFLVLLKRISKKEIILLQQKLNIMLFFMLVNN